MPTNTAEGTWQYIYWNIERLAKAVLEQAEADGRSPADSYARARGRKAD